jgi:hypothetical protein
MEAGLVAPNESKTRERNAVLKPLFIITSASIFIMGLTIFTGTYFIIVPLLLVLIPTIIKTLRDLKEIDSDYQVKPDEKIVLTSVFRARMYALTPLIFTIFSGIFVLLDSVKGVYLFVYVIFLLGSVYAVIRGFQAASEVFADLNGVVVNRERYGWNDIVSIVFVAVKQPYYKLLTRQGKTLEIQGKSRKFDLLLDNDFIRAPEVEGNSENKRWRASDRQGYVPVDYTDSMSIELTNKMNRPLPKSVMIPFTTIILLLVFFVCVWILTHYVDW